MSPISSTSTLRTLRAALIVASLGPVGGCFLFGDTSQGGPGGVEMAAGSSSTRAANSTVNWCGLAVSEWVGERYGDDTELAQAACARQARRLLGLSSLSGLNPTERSWFARWSVLACMLGVERWPQPDRKELLSIILAKAATREDDFAKRLADHGRLRRGLLRLAKRSV